MLALTLASTTLLADPDLPGPSPNLETIPAGSLVIAMDNDKQNLVAPFNLKAYGLVNALLWDDIPVKWAIRAGKAKDGIDFSGTAQRILPTTLPPAALDFRAGPFIVHKDWADYARPRIAAWGNNVAVYELTQDVLSVDVRYTLTQRRRVGALDDGGNANIHTDILDEAGFTPTTHYEVLSVVDLTTLNGTTCYSTATEAHFSSGSADTQVQAARAFLTTGGNFLAQCAGVETYENNVAHGLFQTDNGIEVSNTGSTPFLYHNADLAWSQIHGALEDGGGSVQDFKPAAGSNFRANAHIHAQNTPATDLYAATATKLAAGSGSLVFYLGGHEYSGATIEALNGRRMYMNAVMIPSIRPANCGFEFPDDPAALRTISGTVLEDVDGDSVLTDAVGAAAVAVRIYADLNNNGVVDAGDTFAVEGTTDANGDFSLTVNSGSNGDKYLVAVDSKGVPPSDGFNGGFAQSNVWAEQTYGDDPSTPAVDLGSRFGGRQPAVADLFSAGSTDPASNTYEHLGRVDVGAGDVSGVDFAFSFNVAVNVNNANQGSLRAFIDNASAVNAANALRFVPAVPTNASGGGGSWWRVSVTTSMTPVQGTGTTIDGTAYDSADGVTPRDDNPGSLGSGGSVGVDGLLLSTVARPELEIVASGNLAIGLDVQAAGATIRRLAVYGFGDKANDDAKANILVREFAGALIEQNVIGASASSFTDPATGAEGDAVRVAKGDTGTIRNNLIGFSGGNGIGFNDGVDGWLIEGNEVRGNATTDSTLNGIFMEKTGSTTLRKNLVTGNKGAGLDLLSPNAAATIENNTFTANGVGSAAGTETAGIRLVGAGHTVDRNVIYENYGPGVMVTNGSTQHTVTRNSIYDNGTIVNDAAAGPSGQIGIDLLSNGDNQFSGTGQFVTLNDSGDGDSGGNALLNYPILEFASTSGGILTLTGFARPGSQIELFLATPDPSGFGEGKTYLVTLTEGSGADLDAATGSYGPGSINYFVQGSDTTNRFRFDIPTPPGATQGSSLTSTATIGGSTSEFSGNVTVDPFTIDGTVYEDPDADSDLADGITRSGVTVTLYRDGGDGAADGIDDVLLATDSTDASGDYEFPSLWADTYWVTVNSKQIPPSDGFNGTFTQSDVWAEQTHGPVGALCADGSGGTTERGTAGACYGGRRGGVSDAASSLATAEHVTKVVLTTASVSADFGFGFNVVTNAGGGDGADHDPSANRTTQGSLRQFMDNANAIVNGNVMRFVPATATNASGGGGAWWRVLIAGDSDFDLPLLNDPDTVLDGTAYALTDGVTPRDENPGTLGTGGVVGVDNLPLPALDRPELEISSSDPTSNVVGLSVQSNNVTIRRIAIYGFGNSANDNNKANIRVGNVVGILIEENVIGAGASSFSDPANGATSDNIRSQGGDNGIVRNNLIGFSGGNGIGLKDSADGWTIEGNEIQGNGIDKTEMRGVSLEKCSGATVRGNLIQDNKGIGVDTRDSTGGHTIENNSISGNGVGNKETAGIRLYGTLSSVDRNLIFANYGAGVLVTPTARQNVITLNSIFDNGEILNDAGGGPSGQIGIDLLAIGEDVKFGTAPFRSLNDDGDVDSGANDLLNFPILSGAILSGNLVLTGFARPGSAIEVYIAEPDPLGFGEGKTYLMTLIEGSGTDLDGGTGSYGPDPINSRLQGEDTTNRFQFDVAVPPGVSDGTRLTATATLGGQTSEFSGTVTATASNSISGLVFEDVNYGGGAGRNLASASGAPVTGALVELYDVLGNFVTSTTTAASGMYSFGGLGSADYFVRVVNESVDSTRALNGGYTTADTLAVQTYRNDPDSGDVTGEVGGARPDEADAPANDTTQTLVDLNSLAGREIQSITPVTLGLVGAAEVDFGFNFDTIVNANDSGQGSLRQFISNSNALSNTGLAQVGYPAGVESSLFMIPSDTDPLGRLKDPNFDAARGIAVITPLTPLLPVVDSSTAVDGTSQTTLVGDTNASVLGTGISVGVDATFSPPQLSPEVEIVGTSGGATGLDLRASDTAVRGLAIWGFTTGNVQVGAVGGPYTGVVIEQAVVGSTADSFTAPAALAEFTVRIDSATGVEIRDNLIGFAQKTPLLLATASGGCTVTRNEVRGGGLVTNTFDGVLLWGAPSTIEGNLIDDNQGVGIDTITSGGGHTITNNTISDSGQGGAETAGIRLFGTANTVQRNVIQTSMGAGVLVAGGASASTQNRISENHFGGNGGPAIDLVAAGGNNDVGDGITVNDGTQLGDGTAGNACGTVATSGNVGLDAPVIDTVILTGDVTGRACPNAEVEIYVALAGGGDSLAGIDYGEGIEYLATTSADGSGDFTVNVGAAMIGQNLTALAIDGSNNTSEFGANTALQVLVSGTVFEDVNYGGGIGRDLATAQADAPSFTVQRGNVTVELYDASGNFVSSTATSVANGRYSLAVPSLGNYIVRVVNDTVTSSRPGSDGSELGVQTYRVDGDGESVGAGPKKVGGELPSNEDAAANSGAQTLASLQGTDIDSDGVTEWTQSIVTVAVGSGGVTGVDFGFNFDVVVNTNDAGQGTVRQFILNSNLLN